DQPVRSSVTQRMQAIRVASARHFLTSAGTARTRPRHLISARNFNLQPVTSLLPLRAQAHFSSTCRETAIHFQWEATWLSQEELFTAVQMGRLLLMWPEIICSPEAISISIKPAVQPMETHP